jgi:hypothetical protein
LAQKNCPVSSVSITWLRASPKSRSMPLCPASVRRWNCTWSSAPRAVLVLMCTTPDAAVAPYKEAPAAPRTISTLSMSEGLMSGSPPTIWTPSTM